jgi:hypothetical protein
MSLVFKQQNQGFGSPGLTTLAFSSNLTLGSFLIVAVQLPVAPATVTSIFDILGNTWVQIGTTTDAIGESWAIFYCAANNTASGDSVTVTASGGVTTVSLLIAEWIGQAVSSPFDAATAFTFALSDPFTSPNLTTAQANEDLVFVGFTTANNVVAVSSPAGFVIEQQPPALGGYIIDSNTVAATAGTYNIVTTSTSHVAVGWLLAVVGAPAPNPVSINPTSGEQGQSLNVTVTGTGFDVGGTSTLSFPGGTGITVNSYGTRNATTVTANITIAFNAATTARNVGITNADTQNAFIAGGFTVTSGAPSPASISPTSDEQGFTGNVTVTGTNFSSGTLSFSGTGITVNSYSVQNATTVTANITIASNATLSARDVIVTNADTQTGTLAAAFTVTSGAPVPASVSPTTGTQGSTFNFTVSGTNFDTGVVTFSGTGITQNGGYSVRNATTITINITVSPTAAVGTRDVIVTNADTQTGTLVAAFTVLVGNFNVSGSLGIAGAGATVSFTGTSSGSVTADSLGNFTISLGNGTYTITPTLAGFIFHPTSIVVTVNNADVTGVDFGLPYSEPDCRDFATFPNLAINIQGTLTYTIPSVDSRVSIPQDCRISVPQDSRVPPNIPENSRAPGVFGPDE